MRRPLEAGISAFLVALLLAAASLAQSQTWNPEARARSQSLVSSAVTALSRGQAEQALQQLVNATLCDPDDPVPFAMLGLVLGCQGRYKEALDNLKRSYRLQHLPETLLSTAVVYYLDRDYDAAINSYARALDKNSDWCELAAGLGYAYMRKGDFVHAEDNFNRMIECHPNWQTGYQGLATLQYLRGQIAEARRSAEHAQRIRPYPPVTLLLAKLAHLEGDRAAGERFIKDYRAQTRKDWRWRPMTEIGFPVQHDFRFDPFLSDSYDTAELLMARTQQVPDEEKRRKRKSAGRERTAAELLATISDALRLSPADLFLLRELGLAQLAAGQNSEAITTFRKVLEICPSCNVDRLHLARALSLTGHNSEAAELIADFRRRLPGQRISPVFANLLTPESAGSPQPIQSKPPETDGGF